MQQSVSLKGIRIGFDLGLGADRNGFRHKTQVWVFILLKQDLHH